MLFFFESPNSLASGQTECYDYAQIAATGSDAWTGKARGQWSGRELFQRLNGKLKYLQGGFTLPHNNPDLGGKNKAC